MKSCIFGSTLTEPLAVALAARVNLVAAACDLRRETVPCTRSLASARTAHQRAYLYAHRSVHMLDRIVDPRARRLRCRVVVLALRRCYHLHQLEALSRH
jgi:hypothetical protein